MRAFGLYRGNPRKLRAIYASGNKSDRIDARMLARVGRMDPELLGPIHHRRLETQADLAVLRARALLVQARTKLVNHVRGVVKSTTRAHAPSVRLISIECDRTLTPKPNRRTRLAEWT